MTRATDISAAAAQWLIRLEGQTSPELWDAFQTWLDEDRRHHAVFVRLRVAWNRVDMLKNVRPADGTIDSDLLAHPRRSASRITNGLEAPRAGYRPAIAAPERRRLLLTVAAVSAIAVLGWLTIRHDGWIAYETGVGTHRAIGLTDGSKVDLNTNTQLRVRISDTRRDLVLLRGEALFHAAHDPARPFYVAAGGTLVRAVGTAFAVRIRDLNHVDVLVTEGQVAVGTQGAATSLSDAALLSAAPKVTAGETASIIRDSVTVRAMESAQMTRRLAWIGGQLAFQGETLAAAVEEFNRYNRQQITIVDPTISDLRVGGVFRTTDPDSFVAALRRSFGIQSVDGDTPGNLQLIAAPKASH